MNTAIPTQFLSTNPNSKATFRPGGDAQFVSYLLGGIINEIADDGPARRNGEDFETYHTNVIRSVAKELEFSPALQAKFLRAAFRILESELNRQTKADVKAARKAAKAQAEPVITVNLTAGHVYKQGRWTYPTAELSISDSDERYMARNTKRDGSGEWIRIENGDENLIDA